MFSLLHGLYEELTYVRERPIALLGVESSGKSSILEWLKFYFSNSGSSAATAVTVTVPQIPSTPTTTTTTTTPTATFPTGSDGQQPTSTTTTSSSSDETQTTVVHLRPQPANLSKVIPTVGLNYAKLRVGSEKALLWDLGGVKSLRSIWDHYVQEAEALIWVVDSTDRTKLDDSRETLKQLLSRNNLKHSPLLVFANKQDVDDAMDPVKISLALDLLMEAELRPQCVQPCSSKTGAGIREGLEWMMSCLQREGEAKHGMRIP